MSPVLAVDTSVAVPLLVRRHGDHARVSEWWRGRAGVLSGHALAETYSVLTRLPGVLRVEPENACRLLADWFGPPLFLGADTFRVLPEFLAGRGVSGGAVYDALVGLAAVEHNADLAPRDARARVTYEAVGARVLMAV